MTGLVLRNGRIEGAEPVDLLLENGLVSRIGAGLTADRSIDLEGRHVVPGLWDDHVHLSQHALARRRVDVSAAGSAAEAAAIMAAAAIVRPPEPGVPLVGFGFRDGLWPDLPTAAVLDEATGSLPTVLVSGDLHCCWLNSAALDRFGFGGHATGLLREDDAFGVTDSLQDVPDGVLDGWVAEAAQTAASRGVVGVVDFEMADNLAVWRRRMAAGSRALRISAGIYTEHLDAAITAGHRTGQVVPDTGELLAVGPFKILIDGSLNTRTAFCVDEYPGLEGHQHSHGMLTVAPEDLLPLLRRVSAAGLLPAVHAIGDDANRIALDAFEAVGCHGRIEHAQLLRNADLPRFAALGITASVQPEQAMDDRDVADRYWSGRTSRAFPLRSLFDAGATVVLGSDAPVAPLDPWITIAAAVARARDGRAPWHPEQSITAAEAVGASAHGRRRVIAGDIADLCVVDIDPLTAGGDELRAMPVSATLIAGTFTHDTLGA
ncbi:amidohydrolase family protein [Glaciihabitans sp. INWT7]|uniref:amidohydrolase n=1 Tax=Glaciihabitans sp. INWT7 TaxID=2596912 RepID=UPI00162342FA|nr:amidohydrolase family protein [Glaciihabitans sp. INWT7]QNE47212.1 amidohydrolase family protein [Glaciihabitans sp. INWT7]